jgi:putative phosphoribosyl transferase
MNRHVFDDRRTAGRRLGIEVAKAALADAVVLGLPRGGVPVAAEVAIALHAPLDVIVVRKLGVPSRPELAMGAIGEHGAVVLNQGVIRSENIGEQELQAVESRERAELQRRLQGVRSIRSAEPLLGRSAVLVDDGIATGATMRAAIHVARANGAARVYVATPVAPRDVVAELQTEADGVICLEQPDPFWAVGSWYRHFDSVGDEEVAELLAPTS